MKLKIIVMSLAMFVGSAHSNAPNFNGFDICEVNENPTSNGCAAKGLLDASYDEVEGHTSSSNDLKQQIEYMKQQKGGLARYTQELIEEAERQELYIAYDWINSFTDDNTDNYAYALNLGGPIKFELGEEGRWYHYLDVVEGTDWDNNGKIDFLEHNSVYFHFYRKHEGKCYDGNSERRSCR